MADSWSSAAGAADALERRCNACHPANQLPRHVTARIPLDAWGDMLSWTRPLSRYSRHRLFNLTQPENSLLLLAPLARQTGGYAENEPRKAGLVEENRNQPPQPIVHPVIFKNREDADFQTILAHIQAAQAKLDEIKRFDMLGFQPNEHYVREMQRFGILPASLDPATDAVDVYAADRAYWQSFWHQPEREKRGWYFICSS
jgi:hypothetical protein